MPRLKSSRRSNGTKIRTRVGWPLLSLVLAGCVPAYDIMPVTTDKYAPTTSVELVDQKPERAFEVIARFHGAEQSACPKAQPYCRLQHQAQQAGAQVVWIQRRQVERVPGDWVEYQGRLLRIYPYTRTRVSGVFLRYSD